MEWLRENVKVVPKIKEIKITNEGIIKNASIRFQDGLNIIFGGNATGKTTVLKAIRKAMQNKPENIKIILFSGTPYLSEIYEIITGENIILLFKGISHTSFNKCFLIDDLLAYLNEETRNDVLKGLARSGSQTIITLPDTVKISLIGANIINTKSFELKQS